KSLYQAGSSEIGSAKINTSKSDKGVQPGDITFADPQRLSKSQQTNRLNRKDQRRESFVSTQRSRGFGSRRINGASTEVIQN
ncbi:hypothetical protein CT0861_13190, partial [Colletotrichum tofieldiae]